jgi:uncharacterized protein YidB (DUF937 family)
VDLSNILGGLGSGGSVDPGRLTSAVTDVFGAEGGVDGLIAKLRAGGLGGAVDSWVSTGSNQPVAPARLGEALGPETVQQLSKSSGLSIEALLPMLAGILPMIIDHLTPGGNLPKQGGTGSTADIGSIIGSMLGGGGLGDLFGKR